ncbi:eukaryotic translation initiation factor 2D-like [Uloborus diversus]|uniref:eukaryotic translation initiation factor 2D-like n=1 Tax=Uloborus diversus TaxID=327109 RepID=UPI002408FB88|nr:eukaryotic translation initiation factor 2D-like [Uloborus diversus]
MFRKPYKTKTSTTVKGSDRRKLRTMIESHYSHLSAEDLNALIPAKSEMNQVKAMTHGGTIAMIFYSGTNPVFFQVENRCFPTLYSLWKYPTLLPTIATVPAVLEKICNGADLMAPGIVVDDELKKEFQGLKMNDICAIRIFGNKSAIAIGVALMSFDELCKEGVRGKAVSITHSFKDNLWLSGDQSDIPLCPDVLEVLSDNLENVNLCDENVQSISENSVEEERLDNDRTIETESSPAETEAVEPEYTMDDILYQSFMAAVKANHKKIQYPILSSTFYSSYVLKSCPSQFNLDIKKTTHKKLSVFLKKMQRLGVIQIKELTKGVESIVSINAENENIKTFRLDPAFKSFLQTLKAEKLEEVEPSSTIQENYKFPSVTELHVISAQVKPLFEFSNYRKGDSIPTTTVREVLRHYVKENSLQSEQNPREVVLDPILCDCVAKKNDIKDVMTWDELQDLIVSKMPHAYQVGFDDKDPVVKKGKLEPITVTIDTRTGNKKVTLIQNLEIYGINPEKLAQHVQVAVAASTSVTPNANGKGNLVLIQGNQVRYLQKLFLEMYKVPRKFLRGLENVPKKK